VEGHVGTDAEDAFVVVDGSGDASTVGAVPVVVVPSVVAVTARTLDGVAAFAEVGVEVGVVAVDAGVDDGDVGTGAVVAVGVCHVGVHAVDAPREGLGERVHLTVLLDVAHVGAVFESGGGFLLRANRYDVDGVELPNDVGGDVEGFLATARGRVAHVHLDGVVGLCRGETGGTQGGERPAGGLEDFASGYAIGIVEHGD
jgi:hypothetical protein